MKKIALSLVMSLFSFSLYAGSLSLSQSVQDLEDGETGSEVTALISSDGESNYRIVKIEQEGLDEGSSSKTLCEGQTLDAVTDCSFSFAPSNSANSGFYFVKVIALKNDGSVEILKQKFQVKREGDLKDIALSVETLDFGSVSVGSKASLYTRIKNVGLDSTYTIQNLKRQVQDPFRVDLDLCSGKTLSPGHSCLLKVTLNGVGVFPDSYAQSIAAVMGTDIVKAKMLNLTGTISGNLSATSSLQLSDADDANISTSSSAALALDTRSCDAQHCVMRATIQPEDKNVSFDISMDYVNENATGTSSFGALDVTSNSPTIPDSVVGTELTLDMYTLTNNSGSTVKGPFSMKISSTLGLAVKSIQGTCTTVKELANGESCNFSVSVVTNGQAGQTLSVNAEVQTPFAALTGSSTQTVSGNLENSAPLTYTGSLEIFAGLSSGLDLVSGLIGGTPPYSISGLSAGTEATASQSVASGTVYYPKGVVAGSSEVEQITVQDNGSQSITIDITVKAPVYDEVNFDSGVRYQ